MQRLLGLLPAAALSIALSWFGMTPAWSQASYQILDATSHIQTVKSFNCSSMICPGAVLMDTTGTQFGTISNPLYTSPAAGATFPVSGKVSCSNCSGSGVSVAFAGAIGANGTPGGFKDGSGNFQPNLGDVTNGQWVAIKSSVAIGVTGTFWQTTQPVSGTVTANAGTNLNTSLLALEAGGNLATTATNTGTTNTNLGAPGATACASDTASCSTNQQMQRLAQRLTTINTTLNAPFQANGSIGNTSFAATQATASALNATVVGTGTFAVQATVTAASSSFSSGALSSGAVVDLTNLSTPIAPNTATATKGILIGGQYNSTQATFTNGQQGALQISARGAQYVAVGADGFIVSSNIQPSSSATFGLSSSSTAALASSQIVKASAGNLYSFEVSADSTLSGAPWWVMIFNATTLPADGAVTPAKCYAMSSGQVSASYAWNVPVQFSTGIVIGVSTTGCFTKTASAHAFISGDAQ